MESRGDIVDGQLKDRPAIARRSCDQCRARKVGCDRASPCSNCISARLSCTHSTLASKTTTTPKQRVLISAHYEQKIDGIAKGIDNINLLLRGLNTSPKEKQPGNSNSAPHLARFDLVNPLARSSTVPAFGSEPQWNYSAHIIDLVKAVVDDSDSRYSSSQGIETISSLRRLLHNLEGAVPPPSRIFSPASLANHHVKSPLPLPPLEAAVAVLRWAKSHEDYIKTTWISRILPLDMFAEICRKVYFAVDDYDDVDFILTNGYLYYMFSEHVVVSGLDKYRNYYTLCRENLDHAFSRLPLLLSPSMKVVAALTLGTFNAIENCKSSQAWTFISTAANFCQTLGYHRTYSPKGSEETLLTTQRRLFWTIYKVEKGLALRLGRSSTIRDADITLPLDQTRQTRLGRIQGQVYEQLYSPASLSRPIDAGRSHLAEALAKELREVISETRGQVAGAMSQIRDRETDALRVLLLKFDLVCESALLALILKAIPPSRYSSSGSESEDCVAVAREVLNMHQQCMVGIRGCTSDPFLVIRYMNWAILYTPFIPFNILFTHAVQLSDLADLTRLDQFASSLQLDASVPDSITHPYRLYRLLCDAARLYIEGNMSSSSLPATPIVTHEVSEPPGSLNFTYFESGAAGNDVRGLSGAQDYDLNDWFIGNQQLMSLLEEDMMSWPAT